MILMIIMTVLKIEMFLVINRTDIQPEPNKRSKHEDMLIYKANTN